MAAGQRVGIVHIYTGDDGRAYLEDLEAPADPTATLPVDSARFVFAPSGLVVQVTPPRRQMLVQLSGSAEWTCANGTRRLGPGAVILGDDVSGEGHTTRVLEDLCSLVIPVPEEFDLEPWR
jgi:hypothetical protein